MITDHSAITEPVRRLEVFTGAGRRRTWRTEEKARIVAESLESGASVCEVARRYGLSPQQLFGWRRAAREAADFGASGTPPFVPVVVEAPAVASAAGTPSHRSRTRHAGSGETTVAIELEIDGVTVRIGRDASATTIAAVIGALKAGA